MKWASVLLVFLVGCRFNLPEVGMDGPRMDDPAVDASAVDAAERTCEPLATSIMPAYEHVSAPVGPRARSGCKDNGCHGNVLPASTQFPFAGTVYKESSAVTPAAGVTVRFFNPGEQQPLAEAITDSAGNFIIRNPAIQPAFSHETDVTACGSAISIRPMLSAVRDGDSNCNSGGSCHGVTGTQGAIYFN